MRFLVILETGRLPPVLLFGRLLTRGRASGILGSIRLCGILRRRWGVPPRELLSAAVSEGGIRLAQVQVRQNESLDSALRRFKKQIQQTGILKEAREHEHYEKPSDKRRKAAAARRRKLLKDLERSR